MSRQPVHQPVDLAPGAHGIQVQAGDGQFAGQLQIVPQLPEVCGEQEFHGGALELVVGELEGVFPVAVQVRDQRRLINLYPFYAFLCEPVE